MPGPRRPLLTSTGICGWDRRRIIRTTIAADDHRDEAMREIRRRDRINLGGDVSALVIGRHDNRRGGEIMETIRRARNVVDLRCTRSGLSRGGGRSRLMDRLAADGC